MDCADKNPKEPLLNILHRRRDATSALQGCEGVPLLAPSFSRAKETYSGRILRSPDENIRVKPGLGIRQEGEKGCLRLFDHCPFSRCRDLTLVIKGIVSIDAVILRKGSSSA
jgi:hypothetical protein